MAEKKANITMIPASIPFMQNNAVNPSAKRKVAAYARVSTDSEEQLNSYESQVDYYTKYITERPDWDFADVYTDEGITGCNTKHREGFKKMVSDALAGKIDLIITKSVSRFARNTVDSLQTIRKLKERGVECFFEKENIWTFDGKGELLITIMSSIAQEESRSISQNVTWGKRKGFADGKVSMPYKNFLGYERGEDGKPKIVESEAKIVRLIFDLYLQGKTINWISHYLTEQGIPTPGGKTVWGIQIIRSILRQEKYAGNALLQKTFTRDFLTKEIKKNEGEVPQYFVEGSHPGIVDPVIFNLVQEELVKNAELGKIRSSGKPFSSIVYCGECGGIYGSKTWGSKTKYHKEIWQCNEKYKVRGKISCETPHMTNEELQRAFLLAANQVLSEKDAYLDSYAPMIATLTDTAKFDFESEHLQTLCTGYYAEIESMVKDNSREAQSQVAYQERYTALVSKYETAKSKLEELQAEKKSRLLRRQKIESFLDNMREQDGLLQDFDEAIFRTLVERMTVYSKFIVSVRFRDGREIRVNPQK